MTGGVDFEGIAALVASVAAAIGLIIAAVKNQKKEESKPTPPKTGSSPVVPVPLPNPQSPEDVLKFMAILQADNVSLRQEQVDDRAWRTTAERQLEEMKDEIVLLKSERTRFESALGRWLGTIYRGWGQPGPFPLPQGDDLVTLQTIIPRS